RRGADAPTARRRAHDPQEDCEAEARALGRAFAADRGARAGQGAIARSALVPQPIVTVAGQAVLQVEDLSPRTQTMVALVDGAERGLSGAIPAASPFVRFQDEVSFVTGMQQGLHGSPLMLLPRLQALVHPRKLWVLEEEQLDQLLSYEGDEEDNEV